jgi:hypothetical protein
LENNANLNKIEARQVNYFGILSMIINFSHRIIFSKMETSIQKMETSFNEAIKSSEKKMVEKNSIQQFESCLADWSCCHSSNCFGIHHPVLYSSSRIDAIVKLFVFIDTVINYLNNDFALCSV